MPIERIDTKRSSQHIYEAWSKIIQPIEQIPVKKDTPELTRDTIKEVNQAAETWAYIYPEFAGGAIAAQQKPPKLESPNLDQSKLSVVENEINHLIPKTNKIDSSSTLEQEQNLAEVILLKMLLTCLKTQRDHAETNAKLTLDTVEKKQAANRIEKEAYLSKQQDLIEQKKKSTILSWLSWALWGALAIVGIVSLALTIAATGGASIPGAIAIAFGLANAALAIGSGSTTITKGVVDYNNKKKIGIMEEIKFKRHLNSQKIREGMQEMKETMDVISENWKEAVKVVNHCYRASRNQ